VNGSGQIWKVRVEENEAEVESIRNLLQKRLPESIRVQERTLVTEKGGYGLSSLEVMGDHGKILLYFVASPARVAAPVSMKRNVQVSARPVAVIVIDDVGYRMDFLKFIRGIQVPLTIAILPRLPHSETLAEEIHALGQEVICHMPMEPEGEPYHNPGEGALMVSMDRDTVEQVLAENLRSVPWAAGFNNHMGSAATADGELMKFVMGFAKQKGLLFLDSRTTAATVAEETAREYGVPAISRNVFLDDLAEPHYIRRQLKDFMTLLKRQGYGVAIGHPHPSTLTVLREDLPELSKKIDFTTLQDLVNRLHSGIHEPEGDH